MRPYRGTVQTPVSWPWSYVSNGGPQRPFSRLFLLLHGYGESGSTLYKRIGPLLPDGLIVAPDAPLPLIEGHPLDTQREQKKLIWGHSWYIYDAKKDEFPIGYSFPAQALASFLEILNPKKVPTTVIGYSQGGYLSPFVAITCPFVDHVVGIACSYRVDLLPPSFQIRIDSVHGEKDPLVDPKKAQARHKILCERGCWGSFALVKGEEHLLTPPLIKKSIAML